MLSIRRTEIGVPCSMVTFSGCGGSGGTPEEDAAEDGWTSGGADSRESSAIVLLFSAVESLPPPTSSAVRDRLGFRTLGDLLDDIGAASFVAATLRTGRGGAGPFEALASCRLLTTSFTPSTAAASRAAAARCAALSTK